MMRRRFAENTIRRDSAARIRQPIELPLPRGVLPAGCEFRLIPQIPLMAGSENSVRNIVGSCRHMRVDSRTFRGELTWASDQAAVRYRESVDAGHLAFELNTVILEELEIRAGESFRGFTGPMLLASKWQPLSISLKAGG